MCRSVDVQMAAPSMAKPKKTAAPAAAPTMAARGYRTSGRAGMRLTPSSGTGPETVVGECTTLVYSADMTRRKTLGIVLLTPLLVVAAPRPKDPPDAGFYLPTAVGTTWIYESASGQFEEAVTEVTADGKATNVTVVRTQAGKETWQSTFRVSPGGLDLLASGGTTYEKPSPWMRAGAKPGDAWAYSYSREGNTFDVRARFVGRENVEVPAGKFEAVRVESIQTLNFRPSFTRTDWYVPGVGLVKRVESDREITLKSFVRGKDR